MWRIHIWGEFYVLCISLSKTVFKAANGLEREELTLFCGSPATRLNSAEGRRRWLSSTSLAEVLFGPRDRGFVCKASRCMAQRKRGLTRGVRLDHENQSKVPLGYFARVIPSVIFPRNLHGEQMKRAAAGLLNKACVMASRLPLAPSLIPPQCFGMF